MPCTSSEEIENALKFIWEWPYSTSYQYLDDALKSIITSVKDNTIPNHIISKLVNGLIRAKMHITDDKEGIDPCEIIFQATQCYCDDSQIEIVVQTLLGQPEPNRLIDYWEAISILSRLLNSDKPNPKVSKVIIDNIKEEDDKTTEIIVRTIQNTIKLNSNNIAYLV
jgi:hypothetical protein